MIKSLQPRPAPLPKPASEDTIEQKLAKAEALQKAIDKAAHQYKVDPNYVTAAKLQSLQRQHKEIWRTLPSLKVAASN